MSVNMLTLNKHVCRVLAHLNGLVLNAVVTYSYYFTDTCSDLGRTAVNCQTQDLVAMLMVKKTYFK